MSSRTLKPCTIIPRNLYVERAADRQLRTVINDMGRPAYILVARQMGKTNLLINMKHERSDDIVLYLDLSNRFDSARKWFRNVIDSLIESYPDSFDQQQEKIEQQREVSNYEPNVEFDRHLRTLLRSVDKRVIIVLDEIDSLVGCTYSDVVLAQIRSMYFSRVNHSEYSRLTYVLSGVAEPAELIRDKNISPFNIGEKIYLEDFSSSEFEAFLEKSGLSITPSVTKCVFDWANGNPRITWDICSELEERLLAGELITPETVDQTVNKLYLREYDRAPVDHIRTLVESDTQIRNAIIAIRYSRSDITDDKIKSKLYLAGITKNIEHGELKIKNRVIDEALSDRWIEQITAAQKGPLILGNESYSSGNYESAVKHYEEALSDESLKASITDIVRVEIGLAYMWNGDSEKAIEQFALAYKNSNNIKLKQSIKLHWGTTLISNQEYIESTPHLLEASSGEDSIIATNAKLNLLVAYLKSGNDKNIISALALSTELISSLLEASTDSDNIALSTAYYHQSTIYEALQQKEDAISALQNAINLAPTQYKPFLLIAQLSQQKSPTDKKSSLIAFRKVIDENEIELSGITDSALELDKTTIAKALLNTHQLNGVGEFKNLLGIIKEKFYRASASESGVLTNLAEEAYDNEASAIAAGLLDLCAEFYLNEASSIESKLKIYRALATHGNNSSNDTWALKYLEELSENCPAELVDIEDIESANTAIIKLFQSDSSDTYKALRIWRKFEEKALKVDPSQSVLVLFIIMIHENNIKSTDEALSYAHKFLTNIDHLEGKGRATEVWHTLRKQAENIVKTWEALKYKDLGRNTKVLVKYGESEPTVKKYKHVEDDIKSKKCILIKQL
ncbi:AAA-like domain-containing protein [Pseudomonas sp. NFPP24]|uniref:AAA-like domain-containing protein n=1 Tax=Pseudomonas sp. NFPP24 TaxID=1566228 RepID=UPI0008E3F13F|nr:AAA-like domain-containing protein [Pseudomonas sp. NFPP24]SFB42624.1 Tetratricopeptide repeat-containing protein [Pseudomonas sp. NFPP24]